MTSTTAEAASGRTRGRRRGGYSPGVYDYPHNVALMWWNPRAQDPNTGSTQGAYMYIYAAQRFCKGQIPAGAMNHYFKEADSVLLPPDYNSTTFSPPQAACPPPQVND